MSTTSRYFESATGVAEVTIERGDEMVAIANGHVLADEASPEGSPPAAGWTEVTLTQLRAKTQELKDAAALVKADAITERAQAMEDAYTDLVAAGVTAAAASTLTGYTPPE
ncbi:MAG TPA: hypothetical protein VMW08_00180 [Acidimicrobiales bacterium]|nr:hypothetical protein [Acidimicrobiales bacterium]